MTQQHEVSGCHICGERIYSTVLILTVEKQVVYPMCERHTGILEQTIEMVKKLHDEGVNND